VEEKVATVREAFAPGARVAEVARRRAVSRAQIYRNRPAEAAFCRRGRSATLRR
jgi:transposase-like protein